MKTDLDKILISHTQKDFKESLSKLRTAICKAATFAPNSNEGQTVANIIEELSSLKNKYFLLFLIFWDDCFNLDDTWLEKFSAEYKARIGVPFEVNLRPELVNENQLKLLKEAGCHSAGSWRIAGQSRRCPIYA